MHSRDEALAAGRSIGYPLVLKGLTRHAGHKTEAGLIQIDIGDEAALNSAYERIETGLNTTGPEGAAEGILVQEMITDGVAELILGINRDPDFGPVVMLGSGGILVELLRDIQLGLPPLDLDQARAMVAKLQGRKLLNGFRGRPLADEAALAQTLVALGRLAVDGREGIASLDINPLLVRPAGKGVVAADILMEFG